LQPICNQFIQVGFFISTSNFQIIFDIFFHNLLYNLPPFFPFWVFINQCLVMYLKQGIVQKQLFKLLQLVIHIGGLKNFTWHFMKCFRFALQFLDMYSKFIGTIFHINVDFHQLFPLLQTCILQIQQKNFPLYTNGLHLAIVPC
jgi:hypothetical protein